MKKIFYLLTFVMALFIGINYVNAIDEKVTFKREDLKVDSMKIYKHTNPDYKYVETSAGLRSGYCFNKTLASPGNNAILTKSTEATDARLFYILKNGYDISNGTWNDSLFASLGTYTTHEKYYITQMAVYIANGQYDINNLTKDGSMANAIRTLYNASQNYAKPTNSLSVTEAGSMFETTDGGYYATNMVNVTKEGFTKYKVTLVNAPADLEIVDPDANVAYKSGSVLSGNRFYVRVPVSKVKTSLNYRIEVTAAGINERIFIYKQDDEHQNIGLLFKESVPLSAKTNSTLSFTPKNTHPVKISKQDITTHTELEGAKLQLKDANGKVLHEWVSTAKPYYISDLQPGKYILTEISAPAGFILSKEEITFTIDENQKVEKVVTMYNTREKKNYISKQDITTRKELAGAKLQIKDSADNVIEEWISTNEPHLIMANLTEGKYKLVETIAPKEYDIGDGFIEFEVDSEGNLKEPVIMYNSKKVVTADMNIALLIAGLIATVAIAGFSIFKLNKQKI